MNKKLTEAILGATIEPFGSKKHLWSVGTWNDFKDQVIKDEKFLSKILTDAKDEVRLKDDEEMKVTFFLFEELKNYDEKSSLIKIQIVIIQDENVFSRIYNYLKENKD